MRRPLALLVLVLLFLALSGAAVSAATDRAETVAQEATTTTLPGEEAAGTSPWVLVLIGAAAGAVVGVFTGLARRRRAAEKGR